MTSEERDRMGRVLYEAIGAAGKSLHPTMKAVGWESLELSHREFYRDGAAAAFEPELASLRERLAAAEQELVRVRADRDAGWSRVSRYREQRHAREQTPPPATDVAAAAEQAFPDPTPGMLGDPRFDAIWRAIRTWDIGVPGAYAGHAGATGNHVRAILDALASVSTPDLAAAAKIFDLAIAGAEGDDDQQTIRAIARVLAGLSGWSWHPAGR